MVRIADQEWPSTVVPADARERAQSTGVLVRRMGWVSERLTREERDDVERQLEFWYSNGYCPDALLIAMSALPDGTRQRPRRASEKPGDFLRSRMKGWFVDESAAADLTEVREPPRRGQTFEAWLANRRKQAADEGTYQRRSRLTDAGERARAEARTIAASRRKDPLARVRESERRRAAALESLRVVGEAVEAPPPCGLGGRNAANGGFVRWTAVVGRAFAAGAPDCRAVAGGEARAVGGGIGGAAKRGSRRAPQCRARDVGSGERGSQRRGFADAGRAADQGFPRTCGGRPAAA